jgi:putative ABC transport system substrate-binding protein
MKQRGFLESQNFALEERYATTRERFSQSIAAPGMKKLGALNDLPGALNPNIQRALWAESELAALRFGIQVDPKTDLRNINDVDAVFAAATKAGASAMLTVSSSYFNAHESRLVRAAAKSRLPTNYEHRDFVEAVGLVSYGPNLRTAYALAATYIDKILKGAKPSDLPVQQVDKVELIINQRTARALKLAIPQSLLLRAGEVIQ